jgi:hypothetical protein
VKLLKKEKVFFTLQNLLLFVENERLANRGYPTDENQFIEMPRGQSNNYC